MPSPSHARSSTPVPLPAYEPAVTATLPATGGGSPARDLQHRLQRELAEAAIAPVDRFPAPVRAAIVIGASAALWTAIIATARALLA